MDQPGAWRGTPATIGAWAAHLVDAVLPWVPVRQWVLTLPHRLRYRLAFDHPLCRAFLGVFVHTALGWAAGGPGTPASPTGVG